MMLPQLKLNLLIQPKILKITLEWTEESKLMEDLTTMMLNFIYLKTLITKLLLKLIQSQQKEKKLKVQHHKTQKIHIKKRKNHSKLFLKLLLLKELSKLNQILMLLLPKTNTLKQQKIKRMQSKLPEEFKPMEVLIIEAKMVNMTN